MRQRKPIVLASVVGAWALALSFVAGTALADEETPIEPAPNELPSVGDPNSTDATELSPMDSGSTSPQFNSDPTTPQSPGGLQSYRDDGYAAYSNAVNSAAVDTERGIAYAGTRSMTPARITATKLDGSFVKEVVVPNTTGTWDMTVSSTGDLVVGTRGVDCSKPASVVVYNSSLNVKKTVVLPQSKACSSNAKANNYVMTVVEDQHAYPNNPGQYFWAGTYDPDGGRLFLIDAQSGSAKDYTPGNSWRTGASGSPFIYLRALSADADGLTIGLGSPSSIWRLSNGAEKPVLWQEAQNAIGDTSLVYSLASYQGDIPVPAEPLIECAQSDQPCPANSPEPESVSWTIIGTQNRGRLVAIDNATGEVKHRWDTPISSNTIDRIATDPQAGAIWFTTRPSGALYRYSLLETPGTLAFPAEPSLMEDSPVPGSETRSLAATEGTAWGVTGTSELWKFVSGEPGYSEIAATLMKSEGPEAEVQGVTRFKGATLVGGHWRYQIHGAGPASIAVPGEPKVQVAAGDTLFVGLYPSATLYAIDANFTGRSVVSVASYGQMRPRAIAYHNEQKRVYMSTKPAYGERGGALSVINPDNASNIAVFTKPFGNHTARALAPYGDGVIAGTETAGEALNPPNGESAVVSFWLPQGNTTRGTTKWTVTPVSGAHTISGLEAVEDSRGSLIVGTTSSGWVFAIDPEIASTAPSRSVVWKERIGNGSTYLKKGTENGQLVAVIDGKVVQIQPTRSGVSVLKPWSTSVTFAAFDDPTAGRPTIARIDQSIPNRLLSDTSSFTAKSPRISGDVRQTTAVAVSKETFTSANTVVIATGDEFADALSGAPLANLLDGPILLTKGGGLDDETSAEIARLGARTAVLLGGEDRLPARLVTTLKNQGVTTVRRIGGVDRYATSVAVAKEIRQRMGAPVPAILTRGDDFPDAVAAAPAAMMRDGVVLLSKSTVIPVEVGNYIKTRNISSLDAVGGSAATAARTLGGAKLRNSFVGSDRYETALLVGKKYFPDSKDAVMATGMKFPDSLTASVYAGREKIPMLLTKPTSLPDSVRNVVGFGKTYRNVTLIGGVNSISPQLQDFIARR